MEHRPTLLVKITGNDWDAKGEPIFIDTEDQCRGVAAFIMDEGNTHGRLYGEFDAVGLASIVYMLKREFGEEAYKLAEHAANLLIEGETNAAEADR